MIIPVNKVVTSKVRLVGIETSTFADTRQAVSCEAVLPRQQLQVLRVAVAQLTTTAEPFCWPINGESHIDKKTWSLQVESLCLPVRVALPAPSKYGPRPAATNKRRPSTEREPIRKILPCAPISQVIMWQLTLVVILGCRALQELATSGQNVPLGARPTEDAIHRIDSHYTTPKSSPQKCLREWIPRCGPGRSCAVRFASTLAFSQDQPIPRSFQHHN